MKMDVRQEFKRNLKNFVGPEYLLDEAHLLLKGDLFLISRPNPPGDGGVLWILDFFLGDSKGQVFQPIIFE
jgi:hypothetical protein